MIDGMRADALTPATAPRLAALAPSAMRFDNHWSGGNVSRAGMFSLFYGLPATYWKVFAEVAQPPVLMDLLRQYGYQLGIFTSSPVYSRVVGLDRTALARVPNLRLETISPYPGSSGRDLTLTEEWLEWMEHRDPARPFFGFLFYNAVVANDPPAHYPAPWPSRRGPPSRARLHARYLTATHYVDSLIGRVLDDLERRKLLERTVIVVTSDHGMEFNDSGLGFDGHGTGFTRSQLQTPLLIRWPGRPPGRVERRTSHFDVAPTLVGGLFGCGNPPSDYASGHDLYTDHAVGLAHRHRLHGLRPDRARPGDDRLPDQLRDSRPGLFGSSPPDAPPRLSAGRDAGDAPLLPVGSGGQFIAPLPYSCDP